MKITPLNEGAFFVSKNKIFTPADEGVNTPKGSLKMAICPFLIELLDDLVLLDCGLGFTTGAQLTIHTLIEKAGHAPADITKVVLSHLHKDHLGGLLTLNDDAFTENFPGAAVYLQERELEYALSETDNPSFDQEMLAHIKSLKNIHLLNDDNGSIGDFISYDVTGGHTPFHQSVTVNQEAKTAFYGADNLPQRGYLKFAIAYKSDDDGKRAMELRQRWEARAKAEKWEVLFYHDITKNIDTII